MRRRSRAPEHGAPANRAVKKSTAASTLGGREDPTLDSKPTPSTASQVLTPDLLRAAVRRLRYVGFINVLIGSLFMLVDIFFRRPVAAPGGLVIAGVAMALGVLLSLGLTWLALRLHPRTLLDVAVFYEIALGFLISIQYHAAPIAMQVGGRGWPAVAVWVIVFTLLIPNTRRKMVLATLATAAMDPLGLLVNCLAGAPTPSLSELLLSFVPTAIAVVATLIVSRILYDLTVAVKQARELGSYHLVSPLGRGGMGEVWRAQHRMLARPAAIKLIRPDASGGISKDLLVRFEREAQATAALRSPHTVEVYDFGMTDEGSFYYVMELLTGLDADTLVRRHGPVPPERAVYLLLQICKSLEEAHAREFVHRDIKPANIFICRYGLEYDFVKVLDFGLVKSIGFAENGTLTAKGVVAGTPEYMAPEIARGERHFDHRADLYSLGCVAYRILSGKPVFDGKSPVDLLIEHVGSDPVRPSAKGGLSIPSGLEDIVMDCLQKDPSNRPQSAAEIAGRLEALPLDRWTPERAEKWWRGVALTPPAGPEAQTWVGESVGRLVAPAD